MKKRFLRLSVAVCVLSLGWISAARAELEPQTELDRRIARHVRQILEQAHISHHPVDDLMSQRLHKEFLDYFDPMKMYFLQADIQEFSKHATEHDDSLAAGDLSFAFEVYKRFVQRMDLRTKWALEYADADHDFASDDVVILDPDAAEYAQTDDEAKDRWRRRIKYEILTLMINGKESEQEARERVKRRYRNVERRWEQVDTGELEEIYLTSLAASFDPHTSYMGPATLDNFRIAIELSLEGIGAVLQAEDGFTVIKEIVPGGAAANDGRLKPGDKIVGAAQGDKGEMEDLENMKLSDVVKRIRGKAGTKVRLEVIPADSQKRAEYTLTRQKIQLTDRAAKGKVIEFPEEGGDKVQRIGVIDLPSFYANHEEGRSCSNDVRNILEDFNKQGVDGVIMDLRLNGGGLLGEAISLTGLFIDEGPVVQVRDFARRVTPYMDDVPGVVYDGPLVVLVSKFSASASEIFAGAIQDYGRGIVVGDSSTHGKGSVQKVLELGRTFIFGKEQPNLGAVKLTMQKFYRVNGQSTQTRGVISDIVLPSVTDHEDFSEAKLDYALDFDTIEQANFQRYSQGITKALVDHLNQLSQQRQSTDPQLLDLVRKKTLAHEQRARKTMVFNEQKLRQEHDALEDKGDVAKAAAGGKADEPLASAPAPQPKQKERTKNADEVTDELEEQKEEEPFGTTPYTKEVLRITSDLIRLSNTSFTAR